jgi:hypothetical protein
MYARAAPLGAPIDASAYSADGADLGGANAYRSRACSDGAADAYCGRALVWRGRRPQRRAAAKPR